MSHWALAWLPNKSKGISELSQTAAPVIVLTPRSVHRGKSGQSTSNQGMVCRTGRNQRRGTTLVEVVVSSLLVAIVLVTSLRSTLIIHGSTTQIDHQTVWQLAADSLVEELRGLHYADPDPNPNGESEAENELGIDDNESIDDRKTWDDCDDADGFSATRLTNRDGTEWGGVITRVEIDVECLSPETLAISSSDMGLKRATVRVGDGGPRDIVIQALFTKQPASKTSSHGGIQTYIRFLDDTEITFVTAPRNRVEAL